MLPANMTDVQLDQVLAERIMQAQIPYDEGIWRKMPTGTSQII